MDELLKVLRDLVALEADGKHADESAVEVWERARAMLATAPPAAVPAVTDAMVEALRDIEMAACYGTEEDPDAGPSMLRTIGEIARKALAEIDSAHAKPESSTRPSALAQEDYAEPVAFDVLLREAEAEVRGKSVWKRYIDGTPLSNDVPVWMAVFAQQHARQAALAQEAEPVVHGTTLWLWKHGEHYLAFRHLYPCFTPGGDPQTLGEPVGWAEFRESHDRAGKGGY